MELELKVDMRNSSDGWEAYTGIPIGKSHLLEIRTYKWKNGGCLISNASVSARNGIMLTHAVFSDYNRGIKREKKRCTEKAILALHKESLSMLDRLTDDIVNHYRALKAKGERPNECAQILAILTEGEGSN